MRFFFFFLSFFFFFLNRDYQISFLFLSSGTLRLTFANCGARASAVFLSVENKIKLSFLVYVF